MLYFLFFVSAPHNHVCPVCKCTIRPTCCKSVWLTLKDDIRPDWMHSKKTTTYFTSALFLFFFSRQCVHLVIGVNRASFVWSPVNTQKHDTFRSNYTMSSVYSPGIACTIGAIRLVPVLQGISAGSRCHCRTNGVIRTAIRPILFKLKKKMIALMLDSLLLDNLQLDVGFVYSHHIILAVASMSINRFCTV